MSSVGRANDRVRIGIAGATGYAGQELVRLMARHPGADVRVAMGSAGSPPRTLPRLARIFDREVGPLDLEALAAAVEVVFLALPEKAAAEAAPYLLGRNIRVIDLSGAFRLRDAGARGRWYPDTPAGLTDCAVYGLTERNRAALRQARLVACPGCYPTAALLALEPLGAAGLLTGGVVIDAKSGISGAGKTPSERTHFSECHGSVSAYGVFGHRHGAEMEQELGRTVTFVPHLVPLDRGILETIYAELAPGVRAAEIRRVLEQAYTTAPFVRLTGNTLPEIKYVAYTNFCDIGWVVDEPGTRIVMVACLDNLVKGAAGQAVQNFNIACGFDETLGLS